MSDQEVRFGIKTTADTAGAENAAKSIRKIETASESAAAGAKKLDRATADAASAVKTKGFLANQVSMQVGDFTQQVTGGTSAMRAFAQQAPQLIGAFTSLGTITGPVGIALMAVGAALPFITMGISALSASLGTVSETAEQAKERLDNLGKAFDESTKGKLAKLKGDLADSEEIAKNLRTDMSGLRAAENEASKAILDNAGKMAAAEEKINLILGIRIDQFRQIKEGNEAARKARELELQVAQQAAAAAREKKQQDIDTMATSRDTLQAELTRLKAENERTAGQLEDLRSRQQDATKRSKGAPIVPGFGYNPAQDAMRQNRSDAADEAAGLDNVIDQGVGAMTSRGKSIRELEKDVKRLNSKIDGATNQLSIDQQAAETKLETLISTQETSKVVELADTAKKQQELITEKARQLKTDLESAAAIQGGLSASASTALASIVKMLENNAIDPTEIQQFSTAFALAKASREAATGQILGSVAQLQASDIEIRNALATMQKQFEEMKRAIK
jgi:hypothetical protein